MATQRSALFSGASAPALPGKTQPSFRVPPPSEVMAPKKPGFFARIFGGGSMSPGSVTTVAVPPNASRYCIVDSGGTFYGSAKKLVTARKRLASLQRKFGAKQFGIVDTAGN